SLVQHESATAPEALSRAATRLAHRLARFRHGRRLAADSNHPGHVARSPIERVPLGGPAALVSSRRSEHHCFTNRVSLFCACENAFSVAECLHFTTVKNLHSGDSPIDLRSSHRGFSGPLHRVIDWFRLAERSAKRVRTR